MILSRDDNFSPPLLASPRAGFPRPAKVMERGWDKILAPHHKVGRGWVLDPPHPAPPRPAPPCVAKDYNCKFIIP